MERARQLLPQTWHAFFARFPGLTATQMASIPPIAAGKQVLLCAPTASGKTEAILGPLIESTLNKGTRKKTRKNKGTRIVVIAPTRALCNDLIRRVRRPIERMGWTSDIKSSDSPTLSTTAPPEVLITTPESLDSILSRNPAFLQELEALFLDELHLLHGTARGDQLRMLIQRISSFRPDLQICAASATVPEARTMASLYFPAGPAQVVDASNESRDREMELELRPAMTLEGAAEVIADLLDGDEPLKLLAFANSRREVEFLAAQLRPLGAFAHHGSLSREERLRTEEAFFRAASGVCIATMTLELGIDIGDVDQVILINPPPNVASFSQRIGRSNRRGDVVRATGLYSTDFDRSRFEHLAQCARQGLLFADPLAFRPSILPQQAVSLVFQNPARWVSAGALHSRLPLEEQKVFSTKDCAAILEKMREEHYFHGDSRGRFVADEPAERDYRYGRMHAHMTSSPEVEVIDASTGRAIGTTNLGALEDARGHRLLLAGKHREVRRQSETAVFVESADGDGEANFLSRQGPRYSFALARDLAQFLGYPERELIFSPLEQHSWQVHHFFGTVGTRLLAQILRDQGFTVTSQDAFFLVCKRRSPLPAFLGASEKLERQLNTWLQEGGYKRFLSLLQVGPWARFVPDDLLRDWVIRSLACGEFTEQVALFTVREEIWS